MRKYGMRSAGARVSPNTSRADGQAEGRVDFRRSDDGLSRQVRRRSGTLQDRARPDHAGKDHRRWAARGCLRGQSCAHGHRGACGARLSSGDVVGKSGRTRGGAQNARDFAAPRHLRSAGSRFRKTRGWARARSSEGCRRCVRQSRGLHAHNVFCRRARRGFCKREKVPHSSFWCLLPLRARPRRLLPAGPIRSRICLDGPHRDRHRNNPPRRRPRPLPRACGSDQQSRERTRVSPQRPVLMDAAVLRTIGKPPRLEQFPEPIPGEGEVLVLVRAAALKPVEKQLASGTHYASPTELPVVCGVDGVGYLDDGTRVFFGGPRFPFGAMAERTVVARSRCFEIPEALDDATAAALANPGVSAWLTLTWRAKLAPGETVLVLGATGVTGKLAVEIAKLLGAGRVVAAGRNEQVLNTLREHGADATIRLDIPDLAEVYATEAGFKVVKG